MEQRRKEGDHSFQITHALNGVEKRIPHISMSGKRSYYRCDGYFESNEDPENPVKIIFEYLGCFTMPILASNLTENVNPYILKINKQLISFTKTP